MEPLMHQEAVRIDAAPATIEGMLELPPHPAGVVLFAHGSGSSRFSPRNNYVAAVLRAAGIGTLLVDLLTTDEDDNYQTRFDIPLLTQRLQAAAHWLGNHALTRELPLGLFGASTGAAAALQLAALPEPAVAAVVSRGGRPDLAGNAALGRVHAPTLLIVGSRDYEVIKLNQIAYTALRCEKRLEVIPGATHLFEEAGTLEAAASISSEWFTQHLAAEGRARPPGQADAVQDKSNPARRWAVRSAPDAYSWTLVAVHSLPQLPRLLIRPAIVAFALPQHKDVQND